MSKPIVGIHTPTPTDSTSLYRAWGPWTQLKDMVDLYTINLNLPKWPVIANCDLIFMHRPSTPEEFNFIKEAQDLGKKVWVDYDDDVFHVDASNDSFQHYVKEDVLPGIAESIKIADVLTCSTESIANTFRENGANPTVIENEIPIHLLNDDYLLPINYNNDVICWRGTKHHIVNIGYFEKAFAEIGINQTPMVFMGFRPFTVREYFTPGKMMEIIGMHQWQYFKKLRSIRASTHIVPLKDTIFNRGKSNIAYQEALLFGNSMCVVPNFPEWHTLSGVVVYENRDDFTDKVYQAYNMKPKARRSIVELARNNLLSSLRQFKSSKERIHILKELNL